MQVPPYESPNVKIMTMNFKVFKEFSRPFGQIPWLFKIDGQIQGPFKVVRILVYQRIRQCGTFLLWANFMNSEKFSVTLIYGLNIFESHYDTHLASLSFLFYPHLSLVRCPSVVSGFPCPLVVPGFPCPHFAPGFLCPLVAPGFLCPLVVPGFLCPLVVLGLQSDPAVFVSPPLHLHCLDSTRWMYRPEEIMDNKWNDA